MKARWTKWGPIVYSAVSFDDTMRFSLRPVLDGAANGEGPGFPARVAWGWSGKTNRLRELKRMTLSCRCRLGRASAGWGIRMCDNWQFLNEAEAIDWLIDGER